jgi:hypothetical protein
LLHGHIGDALAWNPLAFAAICGIAALNLYSAGVVLAGWPRLQFSLDAVRRQALGGAGAVVVTANWIYEIHRLGVT